jgi:hypothetical protein
VDADARRIARDVRDRLADDPRLAPLLGAAPRPGSAVIGPTVDPLTIELARFIAGALSGCDVLADTGLARWLRGRLDLDDDYDRFAHHLLAAVLDHRIGPDRLLLVGAGVGALRRGVLGAKASRGRGGSGGAASAGCTRAGSADNGGEERTPGPTRG